MTLLAPLALWGLLALAVPLLLHLRRRRVGRTIQVGSLKHLETLPTAERRGPRVRDPLRLLLRLAILALLALLLAQPVLETGERAARPVILVDTDAPASLRDSLAGSGELISADLSEPWEAIARVDDSLPPGVPLSVAATRADDRFSGPRPVVRRAVQWIDVASTPPRRADPTTMAAPHTPTERRALDAAIAATGGLLGALRDTAGWESRLPRWWRDSLDSAAFPLAVARALRPVPTDTGPVRLSVAQVTPRAVASAGGRAGAADPHWWIWGLALLLFLIERLWARRLEGGA